MEIVALREKVLALVEKVDRQTLEVINALLDNSHAPLNESESPEVANKLIVQALDESARSEVRPHHDVLAHYKRKTALKE